MGFFDVHCAYSGIALHGQTQLLLLIEQDGRWQPVSAAIRSTYDRLGGLDAPGDKTEVLDTFIDWSRDQFGTDGFAGTLECMRDGETHWNGIEISYALVDAQVYDALPAEESDAHAQLPPGLRRAWKTAVAGIEPIDVEDGDQYCGFEGDYGCRSRIEAALAKFSDSPAIVAAIEANASRWRVLDETQ